MVRNRSLGLIAVGLAVLSLASCGLVLQSAAPTTTTTTTPRVSGASPVGPSGGAPGIGAETTTTIDFAPDHSTGTTLPPPTTSTIPSGSPAYCSALRRVINDGSTLANMRAVGTVDALKAQLADVFDAVRVFSVLAGDAQVNRVLRQFTSNREIIFATTSSAKLVNAILPYGYELTSVFQRLSSARQCPA
jgi:hypothetical protein